MILLVYLIVINCWCI